MNAMYRLMRPLSTKYCLFNYLNGLMCITARPFKTSQHVLSEKKFNLNVSKLVKKDGTVVRMRTEEQKMITVIHNSVKKVLTINEAFKLANHKDLHLVKLKKPNPKAMDIYQLCNAQEIISTQLGNRRKHLKKYIFNVNIADHDLLHKTKSLIDSLNKYNTVSYTIESKFKDQYMTDSISKKIQQIIEDAGINFKISNVKGSSLYKTFIVETEENNKEAENIEKSDPPIQGK